MKKAPLFLLLGFALLFLTATSRAVVDRVYVRGTADIYLAQGEGLTLGAYDPDQSITLIAEAGTFNVSNAAITVRTEGGTLTVTAISNVTLTVNSTDADNLEVRADGAKVTVYNHTYTLKLSASVKALITWQFHLRSPIDEYFMLGMGITGVGMMIFSPCWVTWEIKKHGVSDVAVERFGYAMLMFIIGFGLVIMYLWS